MGLSFEMTVWSSIHAHIHALGVRFQTVDTTEYTAVATMTNSMPTRIDQFEQAETIPANGRGVEAQVAKPEELLQQALLVETISIVEPSSEPFTPVSPSSLVERFKELNPSYLIPATSKSASLLKILSHNAPPFAAEIIPPRVKYCLYPSAPIRRTNCACNAPDKVFSEPHEIIEYLQHGLLQVWTNTIVDIGLPSSVVAIAERAFRHLREMGYELFHLSALDMPQLLTGDIRREVQIMLMVPAQEAEYSATGHRVVGEISVHLYRSGKKEGQVENVAYRLFDDWTDFRLIRSSRLPALTADNSVNLVIENQKWVTGKMIVGKVWVEVIGILGPRYKLDSARFVKNLGRAGKFITDHGQLSAGFRIGKTGTEVGAEVVAIEMCDIIGDEWKVIATILIDLPTAKTDGDVVEAEHLGVVYRKIRILFTHTGRTFHLLMIGCLRSECQRSTSCFVVSLVDLHVM